MGGRHYFGQSNRRRKGPPPTGKSPGPDRVQRFAARYSSRQGGVGQGGQFAIWRKHTKHIFQSNYFHCLFAHVLKI